MQKVPIRGLLTYDGRQMYSWPCAPTFRQTILALVASGNLESIAAAKATFLEALHMVYDFSSDGTMMTQRASTEPRASASAPDPRPQPPQANYFQAVLNGASPTSEDMRRLCQNVRSANPAREKRLRDAAQTWLRASRLFSQVSANIAQDAQQRRKFPENFTPPADEAEKARDLAVFKRLADSNVVGHGAYAPSALGQDCTNTDTGPRCTIASNPRIVAHGQRQCPPLQGVLIVRHLNPNTGEFEDVQIKNGTVMRYKLRRVFDPRCLSDPNRSGCFAGPNQPAGGGAKAFVDTCVPPTALRGAEWVPIALVASFNLAPGDAYTTDAKFAQNGDNLPMKYESAILNGERVAVSFLVKTSADGSRRWRIYSERAVRDGRVLPYALPQAGALALMHAEAGEVVVANPITAEDLVEVLLDELRDGEDGP